VLGDSFELEMDISIETCPYVVEDDIIISMSYTNMTVPFFLSYNTVTKKTNIFTAEDKFLGSYVLSYIGNQPIIKFF
jgi:hypothetical protein